MLTAPVCVNCKDYNKYTYHKINRDNNNIHNKVKDYRIRTIGHILGYQLLMIVCFAPGGIKKVYDFQTDYVYPLTM